MIGSALLHLWSRHLRLLVILTWHHCSCLLLCQWIRSPCVCFSIQCLRVWTIFLTRSLKSHFSVVYWHVLSVVLLLKEVLHCLLESDVSCTTFTAFPLASCVPSRISPLPASSHKLQPHLTNVRFASSLWVLRTSIFWCGGDLNTWLSILLVIFVNPVKNKHQKNADPRFSR